MCYQILYCKNIFRCHISFVLFIRPYQCACFSTICSRIGLVLSSFLIFMFLTVFLTLISFTLRKYFITSSCILLIVPLDKIQDSYPHISIGLYIVLNTATFIFLDISLLSINESLMTWNICNICIHLFLSIPCLPTTLSLLLNTEMVYLFNSLVISSELSGRFFFVSTGS